MGDGDGSTGQAAHDPPVSGRIELHALGVVPEVLAEPDIEDTDGLLLRFVKIKVYAHADRDTDLGLWIQTNAAGRFRISSRQLASASERAGRTLLPVDLGLEIYAGNSQHVRVRHPLRSRRLSTWRFTVSDAEATESIIAAQDQPPHLKRAVGPEMTIVVPDQACRSVRGAGPDNTILGPYLFSTWSAFFAYALVVEMRRWYALELLDTRRGQGLPALPVVDVVYPSGGSNYNPEARQLNLVGETRSQGVADWGVREFTPSVVCHEYGHAIYFATGPEQYWTAEDGGAHGWTTETLDTAALQRPENRPAFLQQIQRDFIEGYASFLGQVFLQDTDYQQDTDYSFDMDRPGYFGERGTHRRTGERIGDQEIYDSCVRGYGDWCASSYLWDLVDRDRNGERDDDGVHLAWSLVHTHYRAFARANASKRLNVCMFHDYLKAQERRHASALEALLESSHLSDVYDVFKHPAQDRGSR